MENKTSKIGDQLGGLTFMTILTSVWTVLSGINYHGSDYYLSYLFFGVIIIHFLYKYFTFKKLSPLFIAEAKEDTKKEKRFWLISALEGLLIFLAWNVLANFHYSQYFISVFAMIVGLHFFPLAKVFERKFDYYMGAWTTIIALAGIVLTSVNNMDQNVINGTVCAGCAVTTSIYGLRMIKEANHITSKIG